MRHWPARQGSGQCSTAGQSAGAAMAHWHKETSELRRRRRDLVDTSWPPGHAHTAAAVALEIEPENI